MGSGAVIQSAQQNDVKRYIHLSGYCVSQFE